MLVIRALLGGFFVALVGCAVVNDSAQQEADLSRLSALLRQKRAAERAKSSGSFPYRACPEALLGVSLEQIQARLGDTRCSKTEPTCVYSFYTEPAPATDGGGQELALTFDERGRVSDVNCYVTR